MRVRMRADIEGALDELANVARDRTIGAYLEHYGVPINLRDLARRAIVTGLDMGIAFAVAFPEEARRVQDVVRTGAGLTEADEAQRMLMFADLVEAARL